MEEQRAISNHATHRMANHHHLEQSKGDVGLGNATATQTDHVSSLVSELLHSLTQPADKVNRDGAIAQASQAIVRELVAYLDNYRAAASEGQGTLPSLTSTRAQTVTARQLEVLDHMRQGRRPAEIAQLMCLSEATVRTHVRDACHRLQVHRWFAAVAEARRRGLLP